MCGFAGEFSSAGHADVSAVRRMSAALAHRGPDADGIWYEIEADGLVRAVIAHRLLAVVNRAGVPQPMETLTRGGRTGLAYNGEVEYKPLRAELAGGFDFETDSDTEVILALYKRERERHPAAEAAERVAQRLRGQFAFVVWEQGTQTLVLVRDHVGQKPLYFYPTPDGVIFASEKAALFEHPLAHAEIGADEVRVMLLHQFARGAETFKGVREVPPGTVVTVDHNGIRTRRYWRLQTMPPADILPDWWGDPRDLLAGMLAGLRGGDRRAPGAARRLRAMLREIVAWQMDRGVPVGVLLAGLDSSVVTALAAEIARRDGRQVDSFALGYPDHRSTGVDVRQLSGDGEFAALSAAWCGTRHHPVTFGGEELAGYELRRRTARALGGSVPGLGDTATSELSLFRHVRGEGIKSVLSGNGADESLGGYRPIFFNQEVLAGFGWPWYLLGDGAEHGHLLDALTDEVRGSLEFDAFMRDSYSDAVAGVQPLAGESWLERRWREITFVEVMYHLPFFLGNIDALAMAAGLEIQNPYCDPELLTFAYNLPRDIKTAGGRPKGVLIEAGAGLLPRTVLEREKSGYPSTSDPAYLAAIQRQARELCSQSGHPVFGVIDRDRVLALTAKPARQITLYERFALEFALDWAALVDEFHPRLSILRSSTPVRAFTRRPAAGPRPQPEETMTDRHRATADVVAHVRASARTLDPTGVAPLLSQAERARLIGIGDPSHGTSQSYQARALLTAQLIQQQRVDAVLVEDDQADCEPLDRCVRLAPGAPDDPRDLLAAQRHWPGMWANRETAEFLVWLRAYNRGLAPARRVRWLGLDALGLWEFTRNTLAYVRAELPGQVNRALDAPLHDEPVVPEAHLDRLAHQLAQAVTDPAWAPGAEAYYRDLLCGGTAATRARALHWLTRTSGVLDRYGPGSRIVVWAHKFHIQDNGPGQPTDGFGRLARDRWSDNSVLIGCLAGGGTVRAAPQRGLLTEPVRVPDPRPARWSRC